ncbi:MAG TPA: hypothetical protein VHX62_04995 [Solirubrobacteraceae bacterium]|nr:hypothetical protein [Solirubrobacteraceae bacterium]
MWRGGRRGWAFAMVLALALPAMAQAGVRPRRIGQLDCNGFSRIQQELRPTADCAGIRGGDGGRQYDNGWFVGHDQPALRFISGRRLSGADVTFTERLGTDPARRPTVRHPGSDVTHWFELSPASWLSMDVCDPASFPGMACTPVSDANAPTASDPGGGAALMQVQFYPPGFAPFIDAASCDDAHWCSALTIDSLECSTSGACNVNCEEPVNFAFIQDNGVPTGPPSPQESDRASMTPNAHTLLINPGDLVAVHMFDARLPGAGRALEISERDLTTHRSGHMIASAANGFMDTSPTDCSGTPFNFQPQYSSAAPGNVLPWGPGPLGVDTGFEIGHFEPCTNVTGPETLRVGSLHDTYWTTCHGPYASRRDNLSLEPSDAPCYPAGDAHGGAGAPDLVAGCDVFLDGAGDLNHDGSSYRADWPTSVFAGRLPGAFAEDQPTSLGHTYPQIQFETDLAATEPACNVATGAGCTLPPPGPGNFYPYWTLSNTPWGCAWEFGNVRYGQTFGTDAQYGAVGPGTLEAFASAIQTNPGCGRLRY